MMTKQMKECIKEKYCLDDLMICFYQMEDAVASEIERKKHKIGSTYFDILIRMFGKSMVTMLEVVVLCRNGFPDGALSLARNVYEQFIIASTFENNKGKREFQEFVEKFHIDYEVQRNKTLQLNYSYAGLAQRRQECKQILDNISERHNCGKQFFNYWWCNKQSFNGLITDVLGAAENEDEKIQLQNMHLIYKRSSAGLHAGTFGNVARMGSDFDGIDMGPWEEGQEFALFLTLYSLTKVFVFTCEEMCIAVDAKLIDGIYRLMEKYQKMISSKLGCCKA